MINGNVALCRLMQEFFETELSGLFRWGDAEHLPREEAMALPGKRKSEYGKHRELVRVRFGEYDLSVASPLEDPPLGWVRLEYPDRGLKVVEGPLDSTTWKAVGRKIKQHQGMTTA